jgi:hypothetical protein
MSGAWARGISRRAVRQTRALFPLIRGGMGRGISPGHLARRPDATNLPAGTLAAMVAHERPWDAIREDGSLANGTHLRDRLPRKHPTRDDRAGLIVQDGHQRARKAVLRAGLARPESPRPSAGRRPRCKGVPAGSRAWNRWPRCSFRAHATLHGRGGEAPAFGGEKVGQSLRAEARVLGLRTSHGLNERLRCGGAMDLGRAITGRQPPRLGLMRVLIKGVAGDPHETGPHPHTEDMRSDHTQQLGVAVIQSGLNRHGQEHGPSPHGIFRNIPCPGAHVTCHPPL